MFYGLLKVAILPTCLFAADIAVWAVFVDQGFTSYRLVKWQTVFFAAFLVIDKVFSGFIRTLKRAVFLCFKKARTRTETPCVASTVSLLCKDITAVFANAILMKIGGFIDMLLSAFTRTA